MRKPILVKLTMVILLLFLLSACDGGNVSFKQKAAKMKVELDGYSIVTRKYIQTNQKKTNFDALIKKALDDLDITYHKDRFIRYQVTYKDKHVMFTYKLRTDKDDPRKSHYVLGVIDTTSLKVSILRTIGAYGVTDIQTFVDLFDHTHALIKTKDAIEYVVLQTNEVIKTFEVESQLKHIGSNLFAKYNDLSSIIIPKSVTEIGDGAFQDFVNLTSVMFEVGSQLTHIGEYTFSSCKRLSSIIIPKSVLEIGTSAFSKCENLMSIEFEAGSQLTYIRSRAFENCSKIQKCKIPKSVLEIENQSFSKCENLMSIEFEVESQLKRFEFGTFYNCKSLSRIIIPKSVTEIKEWSFKDCENLTSVEFEEESSLTHIGSSAFEGCYKLSRTPVPNIKI